MKKRTDAFYKYHPAVNFIFFAAVLVFSMTLRSPAAGIISFSGAFIYCLITDGRDALKFTLKFCLPVLLITAFINPAFNHQGVTILLYFPNGNPLTLESILYGLSSGLMLVSVLMWFSCFSRVITGDKFIYLFGKIIPSLSLVLSMTLRFIPLFRQQAEKVKQAHRSLGRTGEGSLYDKIKHGIKILSILVTWSLENAIETADSMKSRGYGLKGRSAFSIYIFDERDKYTCIFLIFCSLYLICGAVIKAFYFSFFPYIVSAPVNAFNFSFYAVYILLSLTPVFINVSEDRKWIASD